MSQEVCPEVARPASDLLLARLHHQSIQETDQGGSAGEGRSVKIAVVGSRTYPNLAEVRQFVWEQDRNTVIVSGGASGVDSAAIHEARRLGMEYEVHLPDWNVHGRSAGIIRNRAIVDSANGVVAFWDGKSRGTKFTIDYARERGKLLRVFPEGVIAKDSAAGALES
jgi:predicted Rossmann fold nucleotide-binding protein DprA/Smf involved in DNA uptake